MNGFCFADQGANDFVFGALGIDEIVAADFGLALEFAVDAAVALFHAAGVPRDIKVEEVGAMVLEVDAFTGGVGGDEYAEWVFFGGGVECQFDLVKAFAAHAAMEGGYALFDLIRLV